MRILVAGDYVPRGRVALYVESGNYAAVLGEVKPIVEAADCAIVNLECPVAGSEARPIVKVGPNLRCTPQGVEALQWAGFGCVTLANNHFLDQGEDSVAYTLDVVESCHLRHVGGGRNLAEAETPLYMEIGGSRLAVINCCEHEFSIATERTAGSNPLNPIRQYHAIREARQHADYVLVIVHGGHEHWQLPSLRMVETYRFFVDAGADAVVNHHMHCYSGYEVYRGKPIFYGLGNFCFDAMPKPQRNALWNYGYMVSLDFSSQGISYQLYPYEQCNDTPGVHLLAEDAFDARLQELNATIADHNALRAATQQYYDTCLTEQRNLLEPIQNRIFLALRRRGLIPSLLSQRRLLRISNHVECEAHRDKLSYFLTGKL